MDSNKSDRHIFDLAASHVYQLMKNDSYPRYLRSEMYREFREAAERKRPANQLGQCSTFDVFRPQTISSLKHRLNLS